MPPCPRSQKPTLVLDAAPLACLGDAPELLHSLGGNVIVTPHAGEMAAILGRDKADIKADPLGAAFEAASKLQAVVAMKGSETYIAAPDGRVYLNRYGCIGLATSGSGDTLAGIIAGLAARGADPVQATVVGVYLHARAGDVLARRVGPLGFLARELLAEIPALMAKLDKQGVADRMELNGKVAVITGGGTGIGKAIASLFAQEGAKIMIAGRREEPLRQTCAEIVGGGGEAQYAVTDVSQSAQVQSLFEQTVASFGR